MRTFPCVCGNTLFFENSLCLRCQRAVGWCPGCQTISAVEEIGDVLVCRRDGCHERLAECHNRRVENVCNRFISLSEDPDESTLCDYCETTNIIPDLSVDGNRARWYRMEVGKRRLLHLLDAIGLNYSGDLDRQVPPLTFEFKTDAIPQGESWRTLPNAERVYTGHADGVITINLREADPVEREKAKRTFNETQRTLIGHFRHESGHYFWMTLVAGRCEERCATQFGDHRTLDYAESMKAYYENGPAEDWQESYISQYASAHPWEDFAETFALYLDVRSVLDTADHLLSEVDMPHEAAPVKTWVARYLKICGISNELNRSMGIEDLLPDVITPKVVSKLEFIHGLVLTA